MKSNGLLIGYDTINKAYDVMSENNMKGNILYVVDPVIDQKYGHILQPQIEACGCMSKNILIDNKLEYSMSLAETCISQEINCIVGFGGGKVLDVCKYAAYITKIPYLSIPTTASNDGIASPIAVLKQKDRRPKSLGASMPTVSLVDVNLIAKGPIENIKAGIGDTISNYMALLDWEFAVSRGKDEMNGYAYLMSRNSLDALMKTQYNTICPEFIEVLVNSLVLSGIAMDFAGSSRPVSGSEHLFSHALDYYSEVSNLHGLQVALGTIAMLKITGNSYDSVWEYLNRFSVDVNPKSLGISRDTFILCMKKSVNMRKNRYTYLNEISLTDSKLSQIYYELVNEL